MNNNLTLEEWRKSPSRIEWLRQQQEDKTFVEFFLMLQGASPRGFPIRGQSITETQAAIELGRVRGYEDALTVIELAGQPLAQNQDIESTFGTEQTTKE